MRGKYFTLDVGSTQLTEVYPYLNLTKDVGCSYTVEELKDALALVKYVQCEEYILCEQLSEQLELYGNTTFSLTLEVELEMAIEELEGVRE